jgi:hypothetical protein
MKREGDRNEPKMQTELPKIASQTKLEKEGVRMDCDEVRRLIVSLLHTEEGAGAVDRAREVTELHLETCASCREWFLNDFTKMIDERKREFEKNA